VSLMGFAGAITLPLKSENLKKIVLFLVSFSAGALFGDAFIHLLPEAVKEAGFTPAVSISLLAGILLFFILEKFIFWRHCHVPTSAEHPHPFAWMNMFGDALHNSIDGMVIAGSFIAGPALGLATTIAVVLHEIPQEIGDYGVLVHGGFERITALVLCFIVQLTAFIGAIIILLLNLKVADLTTYLLPFTAGGFIYIAGSDLIPEMHKELGAKRSLVQFLALLLGIILMFSLLFTG
ncbi:MAG TPA: ZIP family metal transporter, partial [Candidatus Sulfotelmatobacter sp.]|nr:ZIP family metal transporter [Candidatus Sulfotelmatobacter sp.]